MGRSPCYLIKKIKKNIINAWEKNSKHFSLGVSPSGKISFWLFQFLLFFFLLVLDFPLAVRFFLIVWGWKFLGDQFHFPFLSLLLFFFLSLGVLRSTQVSSRTFWSETFLFYFSRLTRLIFDCVLRVCCSVVSFGFVQSTLHGELRSICVFRQVDLFGDGKTIRDRPPRRNLQLQTLPHSFRTYRWSHLQGLFTHFFWMLCNPRIDSIVMFCSNSVWNTHTLSCIFGNNFGTILVDIWVFQFEQTATWF